MTIKETIEEMAQTVKDGKIMSPDYWIDRALDLTVQWQELKDRLTEYEMAYKAEVVDLIEQGTKISQANLMVEAKSNNYKQYCYLKSRDLIVDQMVMLAKKRAQIPNL